MSGYKFLLILWGIYLLTGTAQSQSSITEGIPFFQSYTTREFPGDQQNFDALQWHDGTMLIANAGGLIQHADDEWRMFARFDAPYISTLLASSTNQNLLWAGSYSNIGYFIQDQLGEFNYFTLSDKIPKTFADYSNVYSIHELDSEILFFSDLYLFIYNTSDSTISVVSQMEFQGESSKPQDFAKLNGNQYLFLENGGILKRSEQAWIPVEFVGDRLKEPIQVKSANNLVYIIDKKLGLHTFNGYRIESIAEETRDYFSRNKIYGIDFFDNGDLAIASSEGAIVLDEYGTLKYVFNEKLGFPEDDLNGLNIDILGDLWLLGESTITKVYLSNPVRHFPGEAIGFGDALHLLHEDDHLYIPVMDGLYRLDEPLTALIDKSPSDILFEYPITEVFWNLLFVDDLLWVASEVGIFVVKGDELIPLVENIEVRQLKRLNERVIVFVTYNGLGWMLKTDDSWEFKGSVEGANEYLYELAIVSETEFWVGGVSGNLFRGTINSDYSGFDVDTFNASNGLPNTEILEPTFTGGELIVNTQFGFYQYDAEKGHFFENERMNQQLGAWAEYLRQDKNGSRWVHYANKEGFNGVMQIVPEKNNLWRAAYTPFEISNDHFGDFIEIEDSLIWMGTTESVMHLNIDEVNYQPVPEIGLWSIQSTFDQKILAFSTSEIPDIAYEQKSIQIDVVSSSFQQPNKNEFRFRYGNEEWSEWRQESEILMDPFLPGKKNIALQTRNLMRAESIPIELVITILAPWYLSTIAYIIYLTVIIGLIVVVVRSIVNYRIKQQMNAIKIREIERILELDDLKTKLLMNISHELRTPLTLVTGPVKQLLESGKVEDSFLIRKLQIAHRNGRRLHDLVEQVLDLSRLDSNIMPFNPVKIPLISFTQQVVESFETAFEKKSLKVHVDVPNMEIPFQADAEKLEKIFVNLLSNAIKFSPENGEIEVILKDQDSVVQFSIKDNGRGIFEKDLANIFDRFHTTSDQLEGSGQGIGVGLSLTKEFVELHEGSIIAKSSLGNGSSFIITLPKKQYDDLDEYIPEVHYDEEVAIVEPIRQSLIGKEYTALVVEDNPDMGEYISDLLKQLNLKVQRAQHGVEGKKIMSMCMPDIIISDIMMPKMNGFEFAEWLRSVPEFKQVPIILLSARSEVEDKVHGFHLGISDYLTKPFNALELQARVENLLALKKERNEMRMSLTKCVAGEEPMQSVEAELVQQLQKWIEKRLDQTNITVDDLAEQVNMSTRSLQRTLKLNTGYAPSEFIREVRLSAAQILLETKQKRTISEVAYAVGFSSPSYFSRQYKKRFGTSPSQYLH